jgi:A/G-specific adenine glycosylase
VTAAEQGGAALAASLLAWYLRVRRDLPFRRTRDPYAIWVSEIMLQQTRVDTVVPYFERFLSRFPTVLELADAELDDVLPLWSGLGYYQRARQLHRAARVVRDDHAGALPPDAEGLRTLPGVGAYTAGAIASIAYGERTPLVDGNVARVLARLHGVSEDVRSAKGNRRLWALAEAFVPAHAPGDHNQALMELGATICTPQKPRCDECPIAAPCVARREEKQAELPVVGKTKAPEVVHLVAAVLRAEGRVLLAKRPPHGLFGGLWESPMVLADSVPTGQKALRSLGVPLPRAALAKGSTKHVLSHRVLLIEVLAAELAEPLPPGDLEGGAGAAAYETLAWQRPEDPAVALSTLAKKVLRAAR